MWKNFLIWAEKYNWHINIRKNQAKLSADINERYAIPPEWLGFIQHFTCCANPDDTKWFLTVEDFLPKDAGFPWNEFEQQSLASAGSDIDLKKQIASYWDKHLPIIMCVDGEYAYYAIDTNNGTVVFGTEPEYEEASLIADSFALFIRKITTNEIIL